MSRTEAPAVRTFGLRFYLAAILLGLAPTLALAQTPQYDVNHTPYLQLGNAALGSATDQIEILWQTKPAGAGTDDSFTVEYRLDGATTWISAGAPGTIITGVEDRINHTAPITGLLYDTSYEYRVVHNRAGSPVATYQDTFQTRLAPGSTKSFTFAAYGDSAELASNTAFRAIQNQLNQTNAAFALFVG